MMVLMEYIGVGLIGASALMVLAKIIMAKLLQRDTDYYIDKYDDGGETDE